jgi:pyrimidine operon attenuation protein/uracil phosphoribosyltransferase
MALFTGENPLEIVPSARPPTALDAFYVTRLQRERLAEKDREAGAYVHFDAQALRTSRTQSAVVMHPLPRTDELAYELDSDPRAVYFEQAAAGVPVRMALIAWMLEAEGRGAMRPQLTEPPLGFKGETAPQCANASCITRHESSYLRARFRLARFVDRSRLTLRCDFCERELRIEYVGHSSTHRFYHFDENLYGYVRNWIQEGTLAVFESVKQAEERGYEPYRRGPQREIMNAAEIARVCQTLCAQIIAGAADPTTIALVGIISHGAVLAMRLRDLIEARTGVRPLCAALDAYGSEAEIRALDGADSFDVNGRNIVLVDDVFNSGWTAQRAMTALWRRGRPAAVKLAVLIDRGHRALPIRPDYVGKGIPTALAERVQVRLVAADAAPGRKAAADRAVLYSMVESLKEAPQ